MKRIAAFILLFILISCGKLEPDGNIEIKDIQLQNFNKIELKGDFKVFYIQNSKTFITAETYPNIFKNLKIEVKDSTLFISEKRPTVGVDFYNLTLYAPNRVSSVKMSENSDFYLSSQFKTPNFSLNLKDNAKFIGSVISTKTSVEMAGKSRANLLGESTEFKLSVKDTASIIAPYFLVEDLFLDARNGAYSEVNVANEMSGKIENTAKFTYFGDPYQKLQIGKETTVKKKKLP